MEKITSEKITPAKIRRGIFLTLFVLILMGGLYSFLEKQKPSLPSTATIRAATYQIEVANTEEERAKGLGGRETLPINAGMLFIFEKPDQYGFWMKDTLIPLDMIWISADNKIVHIEKSVQPESFPQAYGSDEDALYVLELNAGESDKNFFVEGDDVSFSIAE